MASTVTKSGIIAIFPAELRDASRNYAFIEFSAIIKDASSQKYVESIFLPMPEGLTFSDTGEYATIDLGIIAASGGAEGLGKALDDVGETGSSISSLAGSLISQASSLNLAKTAAIAANYLADSDTANLVKFATKKIMAPNKNTTFTGNAIRQFSFSFRLVGRYEDESQQIRKIHNFFRKYTYASGDGMNNVLLSYPPLWSIKFYDSIGTENEFIPKLFECYLLSTTSAFNSDSNIYRPDGAPISVDISLQFQESRMLTRDDILDLEAKPGSAEDARSARQQIVKTEVEAVRAKENSGQTESEDKNSMLVDSSTNANSLNSAVATVLNKIK